MRNKWIIKMRIKQILEILYYAKIKKIHYLLVYGIFKILLY